ncbi:MAG: aconitase/3-isopropylmalate dehydratase large subunit family protein [Bacteroidales bacterium]|jgi:homoaconitate hydratase family protein/3-isopropylmalate dehydratase small subunit|nr:aconitase/3-isopropylmalate dehydratase large subunit family protein [Bacteroidales bacterium]MDD4215570.1 aconitase/3-isopropylmalate dehydratase large subunit family protein [Bacteroidales bacterium]
MPGKTYAEKILGADCGSIVFKKPDIVLSHDNTASIHATFTKMGGDKVAFPDQLLIVLDHNAPPTNVKLANDYQKIRDIVAKQGIKKFHDVGDGICHQLMSLYARPDMLIVGSDSHTCTAGAFNAFSAGIDRTETAGLWKQGETWFRVPESVKITLKGKLNPGVYAKDVALWIIGMMGSDGADYMSIEYHGDGVKSLSISDRMTIANLASEMGAKNAVFPADEVLWDFIGTKTEGTWADADAKYLKEFEINLEELFPVVAAPHHVDNVKAVSEVQGTKLNQAIVGTCTNGRIEDIRIAAGILKGKKIPAGFQLLVIPASMEIYKTAMKEGLVTDLLEAEANFLSPSCGPCLGTGQGIPADGYNVISTANRNFLGRMGNEKANIYLASPATVAFSALKGEITDPRGLAANDKFPYTKEQSHTVQVQKGEDRFYKGVWAYNDIDNMNTDQMFAGNLTYNINSSEGEKIMPYLFKGVDESFAERVKSCDIVMAGLNFGCGSSREHPAVGLSFAGVQAVICKSVNRIFYRSAVNQGLPILVVPEAVDNYKKGDSVKVDMVRGIIIIAGKDYNFNALPDKLMNIFKAKGLVNYVKG